jgi:hypothetical protein
MRLTRKCRFGILGPAKSKSLSSAIHRGAQSHAAGTAVALPDRDFFDALKAKSGGSI